MAARRALALLALLACGSLAWKSAQVGAARLLAEYSARGKQLPAAELAVQLTPADPETHYARAQALAATGALAAACAAYEQAIRLRPADYLLWLELGQLREQAGDSAGALAAFNEAVLLAPTYAAPRWQLGNTLLRAGQTTEAFAALRQAAHADPPLYPRLLELGWHVAHSDAQQFRALVGPAAPNEHVLLARYLAGHDATRAAVAEFRANAAGFTSTDQRDLISALLVARSYAEAYEVWAVGRGDAPAPGGFTDGGFEQAVSRADPGFGWQFSAAADAAAVQLSLDATAPHGGARSLRLDFNGNSAPSAQLLAQLLLSTPGTRYRLRFAARTADLVTGGPLVVQVFGAGAQTDTALAASAPLPTGTSDWHELTFEFTTPPDARALRLAVTRQSCAGGGGPCPAFGQVWLDDFRLERL